MSPAMRANLPPLMAISAVCTASPCGRTMRVFLITRSHFFASAMSAHLFLEVRQQAAVPDDAHEERRHRLARKRLTAGAVLHLAALQMHFELVTLVDSPGLCANDGRQAKIDGVAVEQAGERLGDQSGYAQMLERFGRLLARGAGAEVAACDEDVSRLHLSRKGGRHRLQAMARDLLDAELHVAPGRDEVRVDVVAEDPGLHASMSLGSAMCPATAEA